MTDQTLPRRGSYSLRIERVPSPLSVRIAIPFIAVLLAFLITGLIMVIAGINPLDAFYCLLLDPLKTRNSAFDVLVRATPILLTGLAVMLAFSSGYFNIGAEGQFLAGAIVTAGLGVSLAGSSPWIAIPIIVIAGFLAGALWALLPALLKVYFKVDEVVTTLLLNSVMTLGLSGLLTGPWRSPDGWPRTPMIEEAIRLPRLFPPSRLRAGFVIGLVLMVVLWFVLQRTSFGVKLRAVGLGANAARFMGIPVARTMLIAALVSGGIAGIGGVAEILGVQGRLIAESSAGYGYTGVIVAMLGGLTAPGVLLAAVFIALIETGSLALGQTMGVPVYLGDVAQATVLLTMLACLLLINYRIRIVKAS
ncbi:MAG: ABC transporter permease [Anaerolineae bacterium]